MISVKQAQDTLIHILTKYPNYSDIQTFLQRRTLGMETIKARLLKLLKIIKQ
jgi:hypothetical protein